MGCSGSSSKADQGVPGVVHQKVPIPRPVPNHGADEYRRPPSHGADELPVVEHETEFDTTYQIAWIIDDAVPKTKPLPKRKKVIDLPTTPRSGGADKSADDVSQAPQDELPPVNRDTTSLWVSELRDILTEDFNFTHVTESVYATVSELVMT